MSRVFEALAKASEEKNINPNGQWKSVKSLSLQRCSASKEKGRLPNNISRKRYCQQNERYGPSNSRIVPRGHNRREIVARKN